MSVYLPYKKIIALVTIAIIAISLFSISVKAQEDQETTAATTGKLGLQVSAPVYNFTIDPGSSAQEIIKIRNVSTSAQTFYPEVLDFKPAGESGAPEFVFSKDSGSYTYSLASWINISKQGITLKPDESAALNFTINVPRDAEPGGRYAGVLFGTSPPKATGTQVAISNKVGSLILLRIAGNAKEIAAVKEFSIPSNFYEYPPVNFTVRVENTGNTHVAPKGVIEIKNIFGRVVDSLNVNEKNGNVLPQSIRKFDKESNNLVWNPQSLTIGRFTAHLSLNYGDPAKNLSQEVTFWVVPWKLLLVVLLALVILLLLFIWIVKRYNKWIVVRALKRQGSASNAGNQTSPPNTP